MKINIIGAGITGLAAAYYMSQNGHTVSIFDRDSNVGGLAGSFPISGTYLEKYYHHSFTGHSQLIQLMEALNLEKDLFFKKVKMGFFYNDCLYPFVTAKDLMFFNPLKIRNRIRLGLTSLMMMRIKDWRELEKSSALDWLQRYSGNEARKIIWEPLLKMKFGDEYDRISAAWLWNRIVDRRGFNQKKGGGKEYLGYMNGGYKILMDALMAKIQSSGGEIHTGAPVQNIAVENGKSYGVNVNGAMFSGDVILSTVPIQTFLEITPTLPGEYRTRLSSIKYQGSTCVVLKLKSSLSRFYWINVSDPHSPFVGIIEHTNLVSPDHYQGFHLIYLTKYSSPSDPIFSKSPENIFHEFITYISSMFPAFREADLDEYWVFQDRFSQPVFVQNYSKIMPEISTPIPNLYLLNTAQIYPQSRSVNSSIAKAKEVVTEILNHHAG